MIEKRREIVKPMLTTSNSYYMTHYIMNMASVGFCGLMIFLAYLLDFEKHVKDWFFYEVIGILLLIIVINLWKLHKLDKVWRRLAGLELKKHYPENFR